MEDAVYCRNSDVDEEPFEDELLLLHRTTHTVVALNTPAAALWEALRWPQSTAGLAQLLVEAWPEKGAAWAHDQARAALQQLAVHAFVRRVDPEGSASNTPAQKPL